MTSYKPAPSWLPSAAVCAALLFASATVASGQSKYGHFAPKDAYEGGSSLAYYGSENPWNRRMFTAARADKFYKRRGQRQLLGILDGQPRQVAGWCRKRLAEDPRDLESMFMLTVALCQLDEVEQAFETMQQAVAAGLPLARFLAGPRALLRPLTETDAFGKYAADHPQALLHGPMLGAVTDHGARFWLRTVEATPVTVRVFDAAQGGRCVATGSAKTARDQDFTGIVEVTGLEPNTRYTYEVQIRGQRVTGALRPTLRTFPRAGRPGRFRVAFGGGAGYTPQHESIWDTIASFEPAATLLLGDNVYIDLPESPGAFQRYTYYRRQSRSEFRRLVRATSVYAIWDDHDAAIDDAWLGPYVDRPSWKLDQWTLFRQNWNNPAYGDPKWPGCWFRFTIADVDFFLLDCRFYRTNPFGDHPTMLGPVQKAWLLDQLRESQATLKVIASSVPWAPGSKPGSRDTWDGFAGEREQIFSWLDRHAITGVLLLSADRHRSDAWKIDRPTGYPLYDLMSSRLTNIHKHDRMPQALFSYNDTCSFGLLQFDTTRPDPQVVYQVVAADGRVVNQLQLTLSQLTSKKK